MHEMLKGFHEFLIEQGYEEVGRNKGGIKYAGSNDTPVLIKLDLMGFEQDEETEQWELKEEDFAVMVKDGFVYCCSNFLPDDFVDDLRDVLEVRMNERFDKLQNG